jgi:Uma2 family endonuclease
MAFPKTRLSPEEYLREERLSQTRHEYFNGEVFAMAGANRVHRAIVSNLMRDLGNQLRGRSCDLSAVDARVKVSATGLYTYPDVVAACPPEYEDDSLDTILNPHLVVEVLSPSTEDYDRGDKWEHYRQIPSLQHYLLIAQDRRFVEHYYRVGDAWRHSEITEPGSVVCLTGLSCQLKIDEIYESVEAP